MISSSAIQQIPKKIYRGMLEIQDIGSVRLIKFLPDGAEMRYFEMKMLEAFSEIIGQTKKDKITGIIILGQTFKVFSPGLKVSYMVSLKKAATGYSDSQRGQKILQEFAELKIPKVAVLSGICLDAGLEIALACDYRIASDSKFTKFAFRQTKLGLTPFYGGTQRLPKLLGLPLALEIIRRGASMTPKKAYEIGLVDYIVKFPSSGDFYLQELAQVALKIIHKKYEIVQRKPSLGTQLMSRTFLGKALITQKSNKAAKKKTSKDRKLIHDLTLKATKAGLSLNAKAGYVTESKVFAQLLNTVSAKALVQAKYITDAAELN